MQIITIVGKASGREQKLEVSEVDHTQNLLFWLRDRGITIASSCDGDGVCKRCNIQHGWLTCQMTVGEFLIQEPSGRVEVGYL
ncbi:hypothetical protein ACJVC5_17060 [Peredibacter sp. HCB2-198]|uniref:hypothetical protein n=1 Tax=Peredibacter sp. HCB2-198 TaxID=3383025 RepID=UPI0038B697D5